MAAIVSHKEVLKQSEQVFGQFGEKWKSHCAINRELPHRDIKELKGIGVGKYLLLIAMGASIEGQIETIKKYRDRFDIVTNDKNFGNLLDKGIKADYVMLCDANIPVSHLEPYIEQTKGVKLISTVYGNVEWTKAWKGDRYFYINRDSIFSERIFTKIFGETRLIPAGSNVSNAMVVFFIGADNSKNINWSGYEEYYLVGYDYSWQKDKNYYAFKNPKPKRFYMNHRTMLDYKGNIVFTSENLLFSAKWLYSYVTTFNLPITNCSGRGLLDIRKGDLEMTLKKINPDKGRVEWLRMLYTSATKALHVADETRSIFERAKGGLLCQ